MNTAAINSYSADILQGLGAISGNEAALARVAKYVRRVVKEQEKDPTLMTEEEFFAMLERGEEEYRQGKTKQINSVEELNAFLNSL